MLRMLFLTMATAAWAALASSSWAADSPFREDENAVELSAPVAPDGPKELTEVLKNSSESPKNDTDLLKSPAEGAKSASDRPKTAIEDLLKSPAGGENNAANAGKDAVEIGEIPLTVSPPDSPGSSGSFPTLRQLVQQTPLTDVSSAEACAATDCDGCVPGLFGYIDYLNWKPRQQGLDFATVVDPVPPDPTNPTLAPIATLSLDDFRRTGGIRTGIGYRFANGLDLSWNFTHFESGDHRLAVNSNTTTGLISTRSFFSTTLMDAVQADDELHLSIQDFDLNYRSSLNEALGFRLFSGVRWARIDNDLNTYYTYLTNIQGIIHLPTKMDATGVRLGGELHWRGPAGLKIFGRGAYSLLLADFQLQDRESDSLRGEILNISQDNTRIVSVLEAATGLAWCRGPWELSGGYEFSEWFNMAGIGTTSLTVTNVPTIERFPNLFLDGCFLRLTFMR